MRHHSPSTWAAICVFIAAVVHFALGFSIEFSVDEAHYVLYAYHLAWSYFDHPPLVGWIQWPLIHLTSSEGLIRIIPELLWVLSSYLVYQVTLEIYHLLQQRNSDYLTQALPSPQTCGLMGVLTIIASPLPHVLAIGLLPDTILTPISLGLMMMALRWLRKDHLNQAEWALLGILLGLAGLSKYTAAFTALALLFVFLSTPKKPWINSSGFWLAASLALLLICPVLYWNATHDWISFRYQLAHGGGSAWAWRRVAAFIGIQIACFGPALTLGAMLFIKQYCHSKKLVLGALFGFLLITFMIFAALSGGGSQPHWTTPAWLCLVLAGGIPSIAVKSNPIADLYGWKSAGEKAAQIAQTNHVESIAVQNWTLASRAAWYARPLPVFVLDQRQDQFDIWFGQLSPGASTLLINWSGMPFNTPIGTKSGFEQCKIIDTLEIVRFGQFLSRFDFSLCSNWQGQ